jgi:hypothetical protein
MTTPARVHPLHVPTFLPQMAELKGAVRRLQKESAEQLKLEVETQVCECVCVCGIVVFDPRFGASLNGAVVARPGDVRAPWGPGVRLPEGAGSAR